MLKAQATPIYMSSENIGEWLEPLVAKLGQQERRKLMQSIAREMRRRNQQRIKQQVDPTGQPFAPRLRQKKGSIKRQAMFSRLRLARWLKIDTTPESAAIQFAGRAASVAAIHQYGLSDRVSRLGPLHKYKERQLLGHSKGDIDHLAGMVLDHITSGMN